MMKPSIAVEAKDIRRGDSVLASFRWRKVTQVWVKGDKIAVTFGRQGSVELDANYKVNVRR